MLGKRDDLPQLCIRCRKLKLGNLGRFFRSRNSYHTWLFICFECNDSPARLARKRQETLPESVVRKSLSSTGFRSLAEYQLGHFVYDFAVPRLRLLLEVDSKRWHQTYTQRRRDRRKTQLAESLHWKLVRLNVTSSLATEAYLAVINRASELGLR